MSAANQVSVSQAALLLRDSFQVTYAPKRTRRKRSERAGTLAKLSRELLWITLGPHEAGAYEYCVPPVLYQGPKLQAASEEGLHPGGLHQVLHAAIHMRTHSSTCSPPCWPPDTLSLTCPAHPSRVGGAHHVGDEEDGEAEDGGRDRVDADLRAEDPQPNCQAQRARRDLLVARQRAQLLQLLPAQLFLRLSGPMTRVKMG